MSTPKSVKMQKLIKLLNIAYKRMASELPSKQGYSSVDPFVSNYVDIKDFAALKSLNRILLIHWYYSPIFDVLDEYEVESIKDIRPFVVIPIVQSMIKNDIKILSSEDLDSLLFPFAITHQIHVKTIVDKYKLIQIILQDHLQKVADDISKVKNSITKDEV